MMTKMLGGCCSCPCASARFEAPKVSAIAPIKIARELARKFFRPSLDRIFSEPVFKISPKTSFVIKHLIAVLQTSFDVASMGTYRRIAGVPRLRQMSACGTKRTIALIG
jgi:hypothetical protein